jgi:hypothetical protein
MPVTMPTAHRHPFRLAFTAFVTVVTMVTVAFVFTRKQHDAVAEACPGFDQPRDSSGAETAR